MGKKLYMCTNNIRVLIINLSEFLIYFVENTLVLETVFDLLSMELFTNQTVLLQYSSTKF